MRVIKIRKTEKDVALSIFFSYSVETLISRTLYCCRWKKTFCFLVISLIMEILNLCWEKSRKKIMSLFGKVCSVWEFLVANKSFFFYSRFTFSFAFRRETPVSFTFKLFLYISKTKQKKWKRVSEKFRKQNKVSNLYILEETLLRRRFSFEFAITFQQKSSFQFRLERAQMRFHPKSLHLKLWKRKRKIHLIDGIWKGSREDLFKLICFCFKVKRNYSKWNKVIWFRSCSCWFLEKLRIWLNVKWWKLACHVGLLERGWWWMVN